MELPATLATYPEAPGFKDAGTSAEAACRVKGRADKLRKLCLEHVQKVGKCTADECASALEESVLSVRPRFSELRRLGKIEDTKERRRNTSGARAAVWRATGNLKQSELDLI